MFSISDIKALHRLCLSDSSLPKPPKCLELVSGDGLILESAAKAAIEAIILRPKNCESLRLRNFLDDSRTTVFSIAGALNIDVQSVERLLPVDQPGWGRVGHAVIITAPEFERLRGHLQEEVLEGVVDVTAFCKIEQIDDAFFRTILPPWDGNWKWFGVKGEFVYGVKFWESCKDEVEEVLSKEESPVLLDALLKDKKLPSQFVSKMVNDLLKEVRLKGSVEYGKFVPEAFVQKKRGHLIQELRSEGVLAIEALQKESVADPIAFVVEEIPEATLLAKAFVTPVYIAKVKSVVLDRIEKHGWSDAKDPENHLSPEDEKKLLGIICKSLPDIDFIADRLVSKAFKHELLENATAFATQKADTAWKRRSKASPKDAVVTSIELSKHLASGRSLPPAILSHFVNVLHTESLGVFSRRLEELRSQESAAAVSVFLEKFALRFSVYLQGVQNLKDKALRSKLGDDLLAYANETGSPALDKLESALEDHPDANLQGLHFLRISLKDTAKPKDTMKRLQQLQKEIWDFVGDVDGKVQDDAAIIVKKKQLIEEQNSKCQQATDLSLQVLLTLLAVYAQSRPGALKASGKYVPKLLKELMETGCLDEPKAALLKKAKDAVMGKATVDVDEIVEMKKIASEAASAVTSVAAEHAE